MAVYVALLRGINLGSRNKIAMGDLKAWFEDIGLDDARTYIQSGNVVFSSNVPAKALAGRIEEKITSGSGLEIPVILRTKANLAAVLKKNPFGDVEDPTKVSVTFLASAPHRRDIAALDIPSGERSTLEVFGREVYLHTPDGYGNSKLTPAFLEKRLGVTSTTRGLRTVRKLAELTNEASR